MGTGDILGWITLCCRVCPVHARMFTSTSGCHPLDATEATPCHQSDNKNGLQNCQVSSGQTEMVKKLWVVQLGPGSPRQQGSVLREPVTWGAMKVLGPEVLTHIYECFYPEKLI